MKSKSARALESSLEKLAREYVNRWIEDGALTGEMTSRASVVVDTFRALIQRDVRTFAETGKYPEYVERLG